MSVTIKTVEMQYKGTDGQYHGINAVAEKRISDQIEAIDAALADKREEIEDVIDQIETEGNQTIEDMQTAAAGIDEQAQTMMNLIASAASAGTDPTLTTSGMAADAAAAGTIVKVNTTEPTYTPGTVDKLWIYDAGGEEDTDSNEYTVPTYEEFSDLKSAENQYYLQNYLKVIHGTNGEQHITSLSKCKSYFLTGEKTKKNTYGETIYSVDTLSITIGGTAYNSVDFLIPNIAKGSKIHVSGTRTGGANRNFTILCYKQMGADFAHVQANTTNVYGDADLVFQIPDDTLFVVVIVSANFGTSIASDTVVTYSNLKIQWTECSQNVSRFYGKKISIIGDSIDTFDQEGYKINGYTMYYPNLGVTNVNQTWWKKVIENSGAEIEVNASASGSRVTTGYPDFYERTNVIGSPDLVFVALGTNDSINSVSLGDYDFDTVYTSLSESEFRPAYIKGVKALKALHPSAQIVCIAKQMGDSYKESIEYIAKKLGAVYIDASDYEGQSGVHPGVKGMSQIASLVLYPTDSNLWQRHIPADAKATGVIKEKEEILEKIDRKNSLLGIVSGSNDDTFLVQSKCKSYSITGEKIERDSATGKIIYSATSLSIITRTQAYNTIDFVFNEKLTPGTVITVSGSRSGGSDSMFEIRSNSEIYADGTAGGLTRQYGNDSVSFIVPKNAAIISVMANANFGSALSEGTEVTFSNFKITWDDSASKIEALQEAVTEPIHMIIDTDFGGDSDDALAVRVASYYEGVGAIRLLAASLTRSNHYAVKGISAMFEYDGANRVPIIVPDSNFRDEYLVYLDVLQSYDSWGASLYSIYGKDAYRKALAESKKKVVLVFLGPLTLLSNLINSTADQYSDLTGVQLLKEKVEKIFIMGGAYPDSVTAMHGHGATVDGVVVPGAEWNFANNIPATANVISNCPVPMIFCGWEIGDAIQCGGGMSNKLPPDDPMIAVMNKHGGESEVETGRYGFDPITVAVACLRESGQMGFALIRGTVNYNSTNSTNTFTSNSSGNHYYIKRKYNNDYYKIFMNHMLSKDWWGTNYKSNADRLT